jgi:long-chain fatty acid transport protein
LDGELALRHIDWTHQPGVGDVPEPAGAAGANYGTATAFNAFGGPMAGAILKLGNFAIGAAGYAPFGGSVRFDQNRAFTGSMFPGAVDGVARWHGYDASTMSIYGTLGIAYKLGPVSLGVSGNLILTSLNLSRAQNVSGGAGINDVASEGRSHLDVKGVNGSFGVGAMLEAIPDRLWIGASYQAQPGLGEMRLNGTLEIDPSYIQPNDSTKIDVTFHQALPDIIRLGVRYKPAERVELRLFGDITRWSVYQTQCLAIRDKPCTVSANGESAPGSGVVVNFRRYWNDTFGVKGGGSYWLLPELELFAGVGYESAAEPDSTLEPVLADANNISASLGGRVRLADHWYIAASYTHLQFFARDNTGQSRLGDPGIGAITRRPDAGGVYRQWVGLIDANIAFMF